MGIWRIISENWVKKSTEACLSVNVYWADSYGYLWWLKKYYAITKAYNSYFAEGWGGQKISVFPDINMVVVFTGANYVSDPPPCDEILTRFILPAIE